MMMVAKLGYMQEQSSVELRNYNFDFFFGTTQIKNPSYADPYKIQLRGKP